MTPKRSHHCYINTNYNPDGKEVIDGDTLKFKHLLLEKDDSLVCIYNTTVPSEEILLKSKVPIIISTTRKPPKYVYDNCRVHSITTKGVLEDWMRGNGKALCNSTVAPLQIFRLLEQNANRLWKVIPPQLYAIDKLLGNYQGKQAMEILATLKPDKYPKLQYMKRKEVN